jgi:Zn-dependent protease
MFRFHLLLRLVRRFHSEPAIPLGSVGGIAIELHPSSLLLAAALWLASFRSIVLPALGAASPVAAALAALVFTSLVLASILVHRWSHAWSARREGRRVGGVTLTLLGAAARIGSGPRSPGADVRIALAGPLASVALCALFGAGCFALAPRPESVLLGVLALANALVASIDALPVFPLAGGRILRAALWRVNGCRSRSTWLAARNGRVLALTMIATGVAVAGLAAGCGVLLVLIGWWVGESANREARQAAIELAALPDHPWLASVSRFSPSASVPSAAHAGSLQARKPISKRTAIPGQLASAPKLPPVSAEGAESTSRRAESN